MNRHLIKTLNRFLGLLIVLTYSLAAFAQQDEPRVKYAKLQGLDESSVRVCGEGGSGQLVCETRAMTDRESVFRSLTVDLAGAEGPIKTIHIYSGDGCVTFDGRIDRTYLAPSAADGISLKAGQTLQAHCDQLVGKEFRGPRLKDMNPSKKEILKGATLSLSDFTRADLKGLDLSGVIANSTLFQGADLTGANLDGADLAYADLSDAKLCQVNLKNVKNLDLARLDRAVFKDCDQLPIQEPREQLGKKMREEFMATYHCPKNADVSELKSLIDLQEQLGFESTFIGSMVGGLDSVTCGYHHNSLEIITNSFRCESAAVCYEGDPRRKGDCAKWVRDPLKPYVWVLDSNICFDALSYRNGGQSADMLLLPLGHGVFVRAYETPTAGRFYFGLVFAPVHL